MLNRITHMSDATVNRQAWLDQQTVVTRTSNGTLHATYPASMAEKQARARDREGGCPLPPEPTTALPGSAEKKRVMEFRAAMGWAIFHPQDARGCGR
jgi:hypothetical protein